MKTRIHGLLSLVCTSALAVLLAACAQGEPPAGTGPVPAADEFVSTAMVVTFPDGEILFVDQDSESPYFPTLPEGAPELSAGDIVRVTGNGIMLESYPGQYPGITKVELVSEGTSQDAEKYAGLVEQIWQPKDPAEPARATLEYATELAATAVMLEPARSTWTLQQDDESVTVSNDAPQRELDELPDARIAGPTEATLSFDVTPADVAVARRHTTSSSTATEEVACELAEKGASLTIEPGYVYVVDASFAAGEVTYVFLASPA